MRKPEIYISKMNKKEVEFIACGYEDAEEFIKENYENYSSPRHPKTKITYAHNLDVKFNVVNTNKKYEINNIHRGFKGFSSYTNILYTEKASKWVIKNHIKNEKELAKENIKSSKTTGKIQIGYLVHVVRKNKKSYCIRAWSEEEAEDIFNASISKKFVT